MSIHGRPATDAEDRAAVAGPGPISRREWVGLAILLGLAAVLLLANLGNQYLWEDEAQTALLAKSVLQFGVPHGYDGQNYFSANQGIEYTSTYVWRWHTWFPFYLLAGCFAAFGEGTVVARLPFALMGLATVALVYFFARSLWADRRAAFLAALLLVLCVPFLLLARQCRYYSPAILFSILGLAAYWFMIQGRRWAPAVFVGAATLLFHTHYLYFGTLLATAGLHALIYHRDRLRAVVLWSVVAALINLPWMIWLFMPPAAGRYPFAHFHLNTSLKQMGMYGWALILYVFSPVLWFVLGVVAAVQWRREKRFPLPAPDVGRAAALLLLFTGVTVTAAAFATPFCYFRYVAPAIPALLILGGWVLDAAWKIHAAVAIAAVAILAAVSPMPLFLYELTHDYYGPTEGISKYLNAHAKPGDVVLMTSGDLTVKFYTGLHVVGGFSGEDLARYRNPEWVIIRDHTFGSPNRRLKDFALRVIQKGRYETIPLDYPDIMHENRESPDAHLYWTAEDAPPVVIHHRIGD